MFEICEGGAMKSKRLLKFYFAADSLNRPLDNLITQNALASADGFLSGEFYAERILELVCAKKELNALWRHLDGVISGFSESEKKVLRYYGTMRGGTAKLPAETVREIKRVTVKFKRRLRNIERFAEGIRLVYGFYTLF